jgi:hypothetical protein
MVQIHAITGASRDPLSLLVLDLRHSSAHRLTVGRAASDQRGPIRQYRSGAFGANPVTGATGARFRIVPPRPSFFSCVPPLAGPAAPEAIGSPSS